VLTPVLRERTLLRPGGRGARRRNAFVGVRPMTRPFHLEIGPMSIPSWLSFRRSIPARRHPSCRKPTSRLAVEALEDRCLLSAGALDPTFGNGAGYVTTALSAGNDSGRARGAGPPTLSTGRSPHLAQVRIRRRPIGPRP